MAMMTPESILIETIYVPRRFDGSRDDQKVQDLAESILEDGQKVPIQVRPDKDRFVLVSGYHRLEACRALGEATISAIVVHAQLH